MNLMKTWFLFALALSIITGCSRNPQHLVGEYGYVSSKTSSIQPLIKIEASKDESSGYILYEYVNKGWVRPSSRSFLQKAGTAKVRRFEKVDLEKTIKKAVTVNVDGVMAGNIALVQVPAGWSDDAKNKPFTTASGYFALTMLGPVDLVRISD